MKILQCHNFYRQPGGEEQVFHDEARLLELHGHKVVRFTRHSDAIREMSPWRAASQTIWNRQASAELRRLIRRERPAIAHFTNTFPLISPAAYYVARSEGVKIVQSLHNYRLVCPNSLLLRDAKPCEVCVGKRVSWSAVRYGCYHNNRRETAVVAAMLAFHRAIGTWNRLVDAFFAMNEFARQKFIEGGLPARKIFVKPNFVYGDLGPGKGSGGYGVYIGRLSVEKGIDTLLRAWSQLEIDVPLTIVGDGPLADSVRQAAAENALIRWVGYQTSERVLEILSAAKFLVVPSMCYEGALPRTVIESFSKGTPVIASNLGSMADGVQDGETGLLFAPGNSKSLSEAVRRLVSDSQNLQRMRVAARQEFERKYQAETNYQTLLQIYLRVLGDAKVLASSVESGPCPVLP